MSDYTYAGVEPLYMSKDKKSYRLANLFMETNQGARNWDESKRKEDDLFIREPAVFTLKPHEYTDTTGITYPSAKLLFMLHNDVTGYKFAMEVLGSWEHYLQLREHKKIGAYIMSWEDEMKAMLESKALSDISRIATEGGSQAELSAAKYIVAHEYEKVSMKSRRKAEATLKETKGGKVSAETQDDMDRLGITRVK